MTQTSSSRVSRATPDSASPIFPATKARRPALRSISPVSETVVVFPFVPVTATCVPRTNRAASSSSPSTGTCRACARRTTGASMGTAGLTTTASHPSTSVSGISPRRAWQPMAISVSSPALSGRLSLRTGSAPCAHRSPAAATPLRAMPTTNTRLFFQSSPMVCPHRLPCPAMPSSAIRHSTTVAMAYIDTMRVSGTPHSSK